MPLRQATGLCAGAGVHNGNSAIRIDPAGFNTVPRSRQ